MYDNIYRISYSSESVHSRSQDHDKNTLFSQRTNITVNKDDTKQTPAVYGINTTSQNLDYDLHSFHASDDRHCLNITGITMTSKERFSRPNGAWLFTADVTFIYISIEKGLGLTHRYNTNLWSSTTNAICLPQFFLRQADSVSS